MLHKAFYYILILFAVTGNVAANMRWHTAQPQTYVMAMADSITDCDVEIDSLDIMDDSLDMVIDTLDMVIDSLDSTGGIIYLEDSICGVTTDNDTIRHGDVVNDNKSLYRYAFQTAMAKFIAGDMDLAFFLLGECIEIDPEAAEAYFYMAKCYEEAQEDSMYNELIAKAAQLDPDNETYAEALIPIYLQNNELEKAATTIERLVKNYPERTDMLNVLLQIYEYLKDNEKSLETLNRIETQDGQSERTTMAKIHIYDEMGDDKRALAELQTLVRNYPLEPNFRTLLGNWLFSKGRNKEALAEFNTVLEEDPYNENALMSMIDYYKYEGDNEMAKQLHNRIMSSPRTQNSTKILLLKQIIRASEQNDKDTAAVMAEFDMAMKQKQTTTELHELKLAYMTMKNMSEDKQIDVLNQIIEIDPANVAARGSLVYYAAQREDVPEVIRLCQQSMQYCPDKLVFRYYLAMAYYTQDKDAECAQVLNDAEELMKTKEEENFAELMYQLLGDVNHSLGRNEESYQAYEKCLAINPNNTGCLNNYAYYLSEENRDLDKAEAMSLTAVKEEPNNATFLDTYAWILYKQGRYEEANIYIEMALKNINPEEDNKEITDHHKAIQEKLKQTKQ